MFFKVLDPSKLSDTTFTPLVNTNTPVESNGATTMTATAKTTMGFYKTGDWPKAPEAKQAVKFSIKAASTPIPNAVVTFTGKSNEGTDISGSYIAEVDRTTGSDGTFIVQLPKGSYQLFVSDTTLAADGKTYTMKSTDKGGKPFSVSADTTEINYNDMEELTASYPVVLEFKDASGNAVDLTGATLKLGSRTVTAGEIASGVATFSTATSGALSVQLSGAKGFRDLTGDTTQINVTPKPSSTTDATLSVGQTAGTTAKSVTASADGKKITIVLARSLTNVSIPIKVPVVGDAPITVEQAQDIQLSFAPYDAKTQSALVNEIGSAGITVKGDAITVKPAAARAAGDPAGSITAVAPLPDGAYSMTVGGVGFDTKTVPVTVLTNYATNPYIRIANVGGTPTLNANGNVISIAGGVTATKKDASAGQSDGTVSLVGKTLDPGGADSIVDGGANGSTTVDPDTGAVTPPVAGGDVTDKTDGGLNDSTVADNLTPGVVTDPVYAVEVEATKNASQLYDDMTVKVYLENKAASSGTIGLYFDPAVFNFSGLDKSAITLNNVEFSRIDNASAVTDPEIKTDYNGNNYIAFGWSVPANTDPIDPSTERKLLATIKVPVAAAAKTEAALIETMDNRSVYTMDFLRTETGEALAAKAKNDDVLNSLVSSIWRPTGMAGSANCVKLDAEAATRGGFYQIGTPNADNSGNVMHDIRMRFKLPDFVTLQRADFYVSERDGTPGIDNAVVNLYETAYDPKAETPVEVFKTATTADGGYAKFSLAGDKDYFYTVTEPGHWDYPDGTATTGSDGLDCDQFTLTADGAVMKGKIVMVGGVRKETAIRNGCINPQMDPQAYHAVDLLDDSDSAPKAPEASITSPAVAYNGVTYYFTITPDPGKEWKLAAGETMATVAAALSAKLHTVNPGASSADDAFQNTVDSAALTVKWDANKEQFYIEGGSISGNSIGTGTVGGTAVDPLRAGDIIVTVPTTSLQDASYKVTATAGTGGTVELAPDGGVTNGTTDQTVAVPATQTITEILDGGRTTSGKFTFKPTDTNKIDKVVVNGVEIAVPEEQKKLSFTYQFTNISSDQSIYVSFVDKDGNPLSDPYIKVTVGAKGEAAIAATQEGAAYDPATIKGLGTADYQATKEKGFTATLTPTTGFELDTVLVDGEAVTFDDSQKDADGYYTKPYVVSGLNLEKVTTETLPDGTEVKHTTTHTIVATFKPEGKPSTHAIVTSKVAYGLGALAPVGVNIYPVGSTPTYTMTPQTDWTVSKELDQEHPAIWLDGKDKSDAVKQLKTDAGADANIFTYTLPALTGNVTLDVSFAEFGYAVQGKIRTSAKRSAGTEIVPATLTFKRAAKTGEVDETIITLISDKTIASVSGDSKFSFVGFSGKIPQGKWSVTVSKPGYLTYTITEFEVQKDGTHTIYFGDATCAGGTTEGSSSNIKEIPLTAGDAAGDGIAIAFDDASMVVAGWIKTPLAGNRVKADIDESDFGSTDRRSNVGDMSLVQNNMYEIYETGEKYSDFCAAAPSA